MRSLGVICLIFIHVGSALGAPAATLIEVRKAKGEVVPDSYIVVLKDKVEPSVHLDTLSRTMSTTVDDNAEIKIEHKYNAALQGYSAILKGAALEEVRKSKDVVLIEQNGIVTTDDYDATRRDEGAIIQLDEGVSDPDLPDLPWELDPQELVVNDCEEDSSKQSRSLNPPFGQCTDVFSLDTGVNIEHDDFGGRAIWGAVYINGKSDRRGHGTHTSATAVGKKYGFARNARLIAIKVLGDNGRGPTSGIIAGLDYAVRVMQATNRSSIANMSLGGGGDTTAEDMAIVNAVNAGLHIVASAGNSDIDAVNQSPAKVPSVITVGAIDNQNQKADFSNFGPIVDIHAPGVNITSAWIGSTNATSVLSGTSMAAPYVSGIISVELSRYGRRSPAQMSADLKNHALDVVTGFPSDTTRLKARLW